jgi:NAD(P)-dependent dehydrogenase (short-subunit alcohol dehydrogenase family)
MFPIQADVGDQDSLMRAVAQIRLETSFVNLVIANAGIEGPATWDMGPQTPLSEVQSRLLAISMADFTHTCHINTTAAFYTAISMLDLLDAGNKKANVRQTSQVIVISSAAAFSRKISAGFAYSASKAAVVHMWKQLATLLSPYSIRANVYAPGSKSVVQREDTF